MDKYGFRSYSAPTSSLWASGSVSEALVFKSCSPQTSFSAQLERRSGIPASLCIVSSTDKRVTWI